MRIGFIRAFCLLLGLHLAAASATGQTAQLFFEDFDGATPPALPAGWADAAGVWETSASVSSTGSGLNNLYIQGTAPASLTTPTVNLSGLTEGTISYLARRTATYDQASLTVLASTDGGATFGITLLAAGQALPATDGSYQLISMAVPAQLLGAAQVVLRFDAAGGTSTGSNVRIDDITIAGSAEGNLFGFSQAAGAADATGTFDVDVYIDFRNTLSLQGVQFSLGWDVATVSFVEVLRGAAVSDAAQWQLSAEPDGSSARVVLLNSGAGGLPDGAYDPVLTLRLRANAGTTAAQTVLTLSGLVSALAVPTGDDAGLGLGLATHTVTLPETGAAEFVPSATSFDIGSVTVGAAGEAVLTVSNPGGTADLVVGNVTSSNPLFAVTPASATVAPGGSQAFTIVFTPTATVFGAQATVLTFAHNAAGGSTGIAASALGVGGRGDASGDGAVDVLDLVLGIDAVLERIVPNAGQIASLDVFPFAAPDGALDVRDLTVLAQAIVLGAWPDGAVPPLETAPAGKQAAGGTGVFDVKAEAIAGGLLLRAAHDEPVRAIQLSLYLDEPDALAEVMMEEVARGEAIALVHRVDAAGLTRVLIYRIDGGAFAPGSYPLLRLGRVASIEPADLRYGVAVGAGLTRMAVRLDGYVATGTEEIPIRAGALGVPYPNPYRPGAGEALSIPIDLETASTVRMALYDVLGREVALIHEGPLPAGAQVVSWRGRSTGEPLAPGLYLLQAKSEAGVVSRSVVVR
ncbi:MAG: hypothetical protein R2834_05275 [Rhodothermales bacterium]